MLAEWDGGMVCGDEWQMNGIVDLDAMLHASSSSIDFGMCTLDLSISAFTACLTLC